MKKFLMMLFTRPKVRPGWRDDQAGGLVGRTGVVFCDEDLHENMGVRMLTLPLGALR